MKRSEIQPWLVGWARTILHANVRAYVDPATLDVARLVIALLGDQTDHDARVRREVIEMTEDQDKPLPRPVALEFTYNYKTIAERKTPPPRTFRVVLSPGGDDFTIEERGVDSMGAPRWGHVQDGTLPSQFPYEGIIGIVLRGLVAHTLEAFPGEFHNGTITLPEYTFGEG